MYLIAQTRSNNNLNFGDTEANQGNTQTDSVGCLGKAMESKVASS